MRRLMLFCFLAVVAPVPLVAQTITFAWDAHPEAADITGFHLLQSKQSGVYNLAAPIATFVGGSLTTGQIPKPKPGRWYWVLTAYKDDGGLIIDSGFSNEVTEVIKPQAPTGFVRSAASAIAFVPKKIGGAIKSVFVRDSGLRIVE